MTLRRGCRRCGKPGELVTVAANTWPEEAITVEVTLCPDCRTDADQENHEAEARRTGKDVTQ